MCGGIYEIKNIVNGKRYIGSTANFEYRKHQHFGHLRRGVHHSSHLQNAYNKYGRGAFRFNILMVCEAWELLDHEQHFLDTLLPEYNTRKKANSNLGLRRSDEARQKMSNSHKGKPPANKGKKASAQAIESNRRGHTGIKQTEESRHKKGEAGKGHKVSKETRNKISKALKGRIFTDEWRQKLSESHKHNDMEKSHER